jgi:6-phosphofructokinase 1
VQFKKTPGVFMCFDINTLGNPKFDSPLKLSTSDGDQICNFTPDDAAVLYKIEIDEENPTPDLTQTLEKAGPRQRIYFHPSFCTAAVVTCGGLCPGINNVIRALVMELHFTYGVKRVVGYRYGYRGIATGHFDELRPERVKDIHHDGGSILGNSRGTPTDVEIVNGLERDGVNMLFIIGGDGTFRGAHAIFEEVKRRDLPISVIGIPKTIDNDIPMIERTFGFGTAFSVAISAIHSAHTEAEGAQNGIGLVRLMGRNSGYIAAAAALAEPDVNMVLIPEVPFTLDGEKGLLPWLKNRLERRGHAVIVVAEGAGQDLLRKEATETDESGNPRLGDIGLFLKTHLGAGLKEMGVHHHIKYIDPSYIIRSVAALPDDALLCVQFGQHAVHAAMSGRTDMAVSQCHNLFVHVPLRETIRGIKRIDPEGEFWRAVKEATGQPF